MPVSKDKAAMNIYIEKTLKEDIENLAKLDGRSVNNLITKILHDYVEQNNLSDHS